MKSSVKRISCTMYCMFSLFRYLPQWVISLLGILGNLLVLIVYLKKHQKGLGEIPIMLLAFVDLLMCTASIVFTVCLAIWQPNTRKVGCTLPLCIAGNVAFDVPYTFSCGKNCLIVKLLKLFP